MTTKPLRRVAARPDPSDWAPDELLTLAEAAALMWPHGPLSERTLRTAVREGRLPISIVAGKFFVTKDALSLLSVCTPVTPTGRASDESKDGCVEEDLAIIRRLRNKT
jgi:hypothetical protein